MNLFNILGFYSKKDYDNQKSAFATTLEELSKQNANLTNKTTELEEENKKLPFEFDRLIKLYSDNQLNSLFYKLINHVRNDKKHRYLLNRWNNRLNDAETTIHEDEVDGNKQ